MVGHAGTGVAFCTDDELLEKIAATSIRERSFKTAVINGLMKKDIGY